MLLSELEGKREGWGSFVKSDKVQSVCDQRRRLIWRESGYCPENPHERDRHGTCSTILYPGIMNNDHTYTTCACNTHYDRSKIPSKTKQTTHQERVIRMGDRSQWGRDPANLQAKVVSGKHEDKQ